MGFRHELVDLQWAQLQPLDSLLPAPNNEKIRQDTFGENERVPPCQRHGKQVGIVHANNNVNGVAVP